MRQCIGTADTAERLGSAWLRSRLVRQRPITAVEFFALMPGEHRHIELIDGEIVGLGADRRDRITIWLGGELVHYARAHPGLGAPGIDLNHPIIDPGVFLADAWWSSPSRPLAPDAHDLYEHIPELAIEVVAAATRADDLGPKRTRWEQAGLPELWIVDPEDQWVTVARRSTPTVAGFDAVMTVGEGDVLTTPILPRLELDVSALFAGGDDPHES